MPEDESDYLRQHYQGYLNHLLIDAAIGYAIFVIDTDHKIVGWNKGASRLLGYEQEEILGKDFSIIFTPEDIAAGADQLEIHEAATSGQAEDERWHVKKDGTRFFVSGFLFPLRDEAERIEGFAKIMRDFTERRLAEDALRQANHELKLRIEEEAARRSAETALGHALADFQMLMDSITDYAIVLLDNEGKIVDWNPGAERILMYRKNEVTGRYFDFIFTPEDRERQWPKDELQRARIEGRSTEDKWHIRKNGERFFSTGSLQPLLDRQGQLRGFTKIMRDSTAQRVAQEESNYLANHDQLTGLPNRVYFSTRLHQELARSRRFENMLGILLLDLNRFKNINDTMGHHVGDLLLQEVATRLRSCIREIDMVARIGGDEFVIIQAGIRKVEDAGLLAQKIIKELSRPFHLDDSDVHSGVSIGIAVYPKDAANASQLLKNADFAMYRAKSLNLDGFEYFSKELGAQAEERKILEVKLRASLDAEELEIHYQPQIDLKNWQITSVEALLRWKSPDLQRYPVSELISIAEEGGLIVQIGKWVLRKVCHQVKLWRDSNLPDLRVAVNLSMLQFKDPGFFEAVRMSIEECGIPPTSIEMEITERLLVENAASSIEMLQQLKTLGVLISVDDFGTGYLALSHLRNYPIDVIKIDQSLIEHLPNNREDMAIVSSLISLAHNLGIKVVAEGVESTEQLAFLKMHGCESAQGFLFNPPVPADDISSLMRKGHWSRMHPLLR